MKTVGLLSLMMQSGFGVPADPTSELPVFSGLFVDMGDDQSIEDDLSTFSSRLQWMRETVKQFEVGLHSKNEKISIQMSARKLRFDWFEVLRSSRKLDYIVLGHNKNDHSETILMNLIKGTGIKGLTGIKTIKKKIFRPMLEMERLEIEKWVLKNKFVYRTDKSNYSNKYLRNYIRNVIVPKLKNVNPSLISTLSENSIKVKNSLKNLHFFYV